MKIKRGFEVYFIDTSTQLSLPFYESGLVAGFPSPAANYIAPKVDLNFALMLNEENTRITEVLDDDMSGAKLYQGDWAILQTDMQARRNHKLFCRVDGEDMFRKLDYDYKNKTAVLSATNRRIKDIVINEDTQCIVNGVVTYSITPHIPTKFYPNSGKPNTVNLNELVVKNKAQTFYGFIDGDSMKDSKIHHKDLAIIDRAIPYIDGFKALCRIRDEFTIKFIQWDKKDKDVLWLMPANDNFPPIKVEKKDESVQLHGIVAFTITPLNGRFPNI